MLRDIAAGLFCVLLGAAAMAAYCYRNEIRAYLKLQSNGTTDAVASLIAGGKTLYDQIQAARPKPSV